MESILLTLLVFLLMGAALIILGRGWPRSSHLGGYRARSRDAAGRSPAREQETGEAIREDDDARWRWGNPDDRGGPPDRR